MIFISSLYLPPNCSYSLTITSGDKQLFHSCSTHSSPILLSSTMSSSSSPSSSSVRVEFRGSSESTADGFQVTLVSVPHDLVSLVEIMNRDDDAGDDLDTVMMTKFLQMILNQKNSMIQKQDTKPVLSVTRERRKNFVVVEKRNMSNIRSLSPG